MSLRDRPNTLLDSGADLIATCPTRKRCYASRTAAQRGLKSMRRGDHVPKTSRRPFPLNVYQCDRCGHFHVGHSLLVTRPL